MYSGVEKGETQAKEKIRVTMATGNGKLGIINSVLWRKKPWVSVLEFQEVLLEHSEMQCPVTHDSCSLWIPL